QPDVLLLDEPTNHLDVESIEWLEKFLLEQNNLTLLFISHDRAFVDSIATRIVELDRGILRSYEGNYSRYLDLKAQQLEAEEKQNALFEKKLAEEEAWIRQ
ncbi:ABC transporter ATP-binding protein, partial [Escherichia coli]|nr:ABC transporter ATP-binding protein [Escherichia coli]